MKMTLVAAVHYLKKFSLQKDEGFQVIINKKLHDEILIAIRKVRPATAWVDLDLQTEELKPLFTEFARADVRISLLETFADNPSEESEWSISVFSKFLLVTSCFPQAPISFHVRCKTVQDAFERRACSLGLVFAQKAPLQRNATAKNGTPRTNGTRNSKLATA
jgi:hypothetical protein